MTLRFLTEDTRWMVARFLRCGTLEEGPGLGVRVGVDVEFSFTHVEFQMLKELNIQDGRSNRQF